MVRVYRVFGREGSQFVLVGEVCLGYSRARYRRPGPSFDPAHPWFSIGIVWIGGTVESAYTIYNVSVEKGWMSLMPFVMASFKVLRNEHKPGVSSHLSFCSLCNWRPASISLHRQVPGTTGKGHTLKIQTRKMV